MASLPIRPLTHPKVPSRVIMDWIDRWKEVQSRHSHVAPSNTAACQCRQKIAVDVFRHSDRQARSEEHTSELQSLMRISYAVFCLKNTKKQMTEITTDILTIRSP